MSLASQGASAATVPTVVYFLNQYIIPRRMIGLSTKSEIKYFNCYDRVFSRVKSATLWPLEGVMRGFEGRRDRGQESLGPGRDMYGTGR